MSLHFIDEEEDSGDICQTDEIKNQTDKIIHTYFKEEQIEQLELNWAITKNVKSTLSKMVEIVLEGRGCRTLNYLETNCQGDVQKSEFENKLMTALLNVQERVIVRVKKGKKIHSKGDYIQTKEGNVKMKDGTPMKYEEDVVKPDKLIPLYPLSQGGSQSSVRKLLGEVNIPYNFTKLREKYIALEDPQKAKRLIRELFTKHYDIGLTDDVFDRIMVWFCNAKGKALGYHPAYGCMLAIVGAGGTGKSVLAENLQKTYAHLFDTIEVDSIEWASLFDPFNSVWEIRGLIPLNEVCQLDQANRETFKNRMTAKTITINNKHEKPYKVDNWATLFSATNDPVLPILGNQENRRIIEVMLKGRRTKDQWIPTEELDKYFEEIWIACPHSYEHSYGDSAQVFEKMLEESNMMISEEMFPIAKRVFRRKEEFVQYGDVVSVMLLKKVLKSEYQYIRDADFMSWCYKNGILTIENNRSRRKHFNESLFDKLYDDYSEHNDNDLNEEEEMEIECVNSQSEFDIDSLLSDKAMKNLKEMCSRNKNLDMAKILNNVGARQ